MTANLSVQSVVVAAKDQVSCAMEGEIAILSLANGIYYGLDLIGAQVWTLLQEPRSVAEICDAIIEEYEVEPESCHRDLLALLERLWSEGLIDVRVDPAAQMVGRTH
jgi:Coenzyme PQQ synthesis protein D (PqqD)